MAPSEHKSDPGTMFLIGLAAWIIPGWGYWLLGERTRAIIVCVTLLLTFATGLYIGSIGVIDPAGSKAWYCAQILNSPAIFFIGRHVAQTQNYPVFARPNEIGQIYTSIAGLLNLLCIINCVHMVHLRGQIIQEGKV